MTISCLFCEKNVKADEPDYKHTRTLYLCKRCGLIHLEEEALDDFPAEHFTPNDKSAISITLRNEWERRGRKAPPEKLKLDDLHRIASQFRPLDPLEKMDHALLKIEKVSRHVAQRLKVQILYDYPLYFCSEQKELLAILRLLEQEQLISTEDPLNPHNDLHISAKGYQRLREIQKPNRLSNQCFVAMWFAEEMDNVFKKAVKPAIEFTEPGEIEPRFRAIKIDNVEHTNDINDEIIAQIRRSRFIVCDLTGYRGGVYFEAGFAYGLGLDVIYTCRKDWTKEETLKDFDGNLVEVLLDSKDKEINVKKEGVHFDLAHRNRIEWESDKLGDFKTKLENRIKAVIV